MYNYSPKAVDAEKIVEYERKFEIRVAVVDAKAGYAVMRDGDDWRIAWI